MPILATASRSCASSSGENAPFFRSPARFSLKDCVACHAFTCNKETYYSGPKLGGLFGRRAAGVEDYENYSEELKNSGIVWSDETLDEYLEDPGKIAPDNRMAYDGKIDDAEKRRQMIAYLKTEDPTVNLCPEE